jgi:hypothetical protein
MMKELKPNWMTAMRDSFLGTAAERRREPRRYLKLPIEVRVASGATYPGFSRDLCRFSMGAVVSTPLNIGEEVWITFDYPAAGETPVRPIVRHATVRQRLGFRYGFEFASPLDE